MRPTGKLFRFDWNSPYQLAPKLHYWQKSGADSLSGVALFSVSSARHQNMQFANLTLLNCLGHEAAKWAITTWQLLWGAICPIIVEHMLQMSCEVERAMKLMLLIVGVFHDCKPWVRPTGWYRSSHNTPGCFIQNSVRCSNRNSLQSAALCVFFSFQSRLISSCKVSFGDKWPHQNGETSRGFSVCLAP